MEYHEIQIGDTFSFEHQIAKEDVHAFAKLTGDYSPIHVDEEFGMHSTYRKNIVHGMLAASLFSTLVGMYGTAQNSIYMSQSISFRRPIFYGARVIVRGVVTAKHDSIKVICMQTEIIDNSTIAIDGEARIKVMEYGK